jgi:hypothetical protein
MFDNSKIEDCEFINLITHEIAPAGILLIQNSASVKV